MRFANQVAIITGGAGAGIGITTARFLAREGANIVLTDASEKRTMKFSKEIASTYGVKTLGMVCDVGNRVAVETMVQRALEEFGKIDILVNSAGWDKISPLTDLDYETILKIVYTNLVGTIHVTWSVLPSMIRQKKGGIVNLSSIAALTADTGNSAVYSACKMGIVGFTSQLARQVAPHGIRVNAVAPGVILNGVNIMPQEQLNELIGRFMSLGRGGRPEEVANTILFLLSDDASFISGSTLKIAGGW